MDPVTCMAVASSAFGVLKKGFAIGKDIESMAVDLSRWMGALSDLDQAEKEAKNPPIFKKMFAGKMMGHGEENVAATMKLIDMKIDGIIHLMPLSCCPESMIEPYINCLCEKTNIPLLRIPIDENNSEANLDTRLETFIKLIKWKHASRN